MALPIEDYAVIGDTQTAAIVGRDGSIDWLCLPRFDSGACFAAILGDESHGHWRIAPAVPVRHVRRRYRDRSLVLETEFHTAEGVVRIIDCMPPREHETDVVRIVEGIEGRVPMRLEIVIRFDYGQSVPWVRRTTTGIQAVAGPDALTIETPVPLEGRNQRTFGDFTVRRGERVPFTLVWHPSHCDLPARADPEALVRGTDDFWRSWTRRCTFTGEYEDLVTRSLMTLKALTYAPTGGILAAATTSLPERLGGVRNWDYRYCWVRDATFTLHAFLLEGYREEAAAWRDWLLRAVAGNPNQLQIMYGAAGERRLPELVLPWLPGYEGSRPVRIGNAASDQFQLDVYGEVLDVMHHAREHRNGITSSFAADQENPADDGPAWQLQLALLRSLEERWREPDEGIWEVRGPRRHFVHSKMMAWVAADRAVRAIEGHGLPGDAARWRELRDEIHRDVCARGWDESVGAFVQHYGSTRVDASILMMPLVGFLPPDDPRVASTIDVVDKRLSSGPLVYRYEADTSAVDGLPPGEGAFLACSFWMCDALIAIGRRDEAKSRFDDVVALCNDVGLLAEEYDPDSGRMLGNFPQAFSHVGLINTARNLGAPP